MPEARAHLRIRGRVQGVYYRGSMQEAARSLGLHGWVRNVADGTVEAVVEGDEGRIGSLVEWCREGPRGAHVTSVETSWEAPTGEFEQFRVRRSS